MMNARECAASVLNEFEQSNRSMDSIIEKSFATADLDRRDRRLVFEIVQGILRNRTYLDYVIGKYLSDESFKDNAHLIQILRIGMYQSVYLDKIPDHASVNECVKLAKSDKKTRNVSNVVNAVLRKIIQEKQKLPKPPLAEDLAYRLSVIYSHPLWLVRRWLAAYGLANTKKILTFFNTRPDIFIRRKVRGLSRQLFESHARDICEVGTGGKGYKGLYYKLKRQLLPDDIQLFREGACTVQAESSGWVVALLDVRKGDTVLDMCAAPGGKTALIQELTEETGRVIATDIDTTRLRLTKQNLVRMGMTSTLNIVCDATAMPFDGLFDKILLDAPCSGTGVMHRHPESRWIRTLEQIDTIVQVQKTLLDAAAAALTPKGILVYATCSLEPEENHLQIKDFLGRHPEFSIEKPSTEAIKPTYLDNDGYLFITPFEHKMDGMFAVRLKKE